MEVFIHAPPSNTMHLPIAQVRAMYMVTSALESQGSITDAHVSIFLKRNQAFKQQYWTVLI